MNATNCKIQTSELWTLGEYDGPRVNIFEFSDSFSFKGDAEAFGLLDLYDV